MSDREEILLSAFVAVEGAHAYSAFLPSIFTIRTFVRDGEGLEAIREGELLASAFVLALGFIVGTLTSSSRPLLFALGTVAVMVPVYERAVRGSVL